MKINENPISINDESPMLITTTIHDGETDDGLVGSESPSGARSLPQH